MKPTLNLLSLAAVVCSHLTTIHLHAQTTAFTYQGFLTEQGAPATGVYDFQFRLFTSTNNLSLPLGSTLVGDAGVTNGLFTVQLDFGAGAFTGGSRWLEIAVRPGASSGSYTTLLPLYPVSPTPYAITALGAAAGSIGAAALADGAVTGAKLASNSITAASLGTNVVVNTANIADGAVTSNKLANASVGGDQLVKPYEAGGVSDFDFFFRLERTQETNVTFNAPFTALPVLSLGLEARDTDFAESSVPRTLNRTSNGFALQFTVTNTIDTKIASSQADSSFTGVSAAFVFGRSAVAFANVGCVETFLVTNTICEVVTNLYCCGNGPQGYQCYSTDSALYSQVGCPYGSLTNRYITNCYNQGIMVTNCSGSVSFARSSDDLGNGFETVDIATGGTPQQPSLAVVNNLPSVSFYDGTSTRLRYVQSSNSVGSAWRTPQTPVNHADVGRFSSLADVGGAPAISYFNATSNLLEYIRGPLFVGVPQWNSHVVVGSTAGRHTSLMMLNERPVIACYYRLLAFGGGFVSFYRANDATGSSWGSRISVAPAGDLVTGTGTTNESVISLALVQGRPAIAFYNEADNVMQYVRASNTNGTAWGTPVSIPLLTFSGGFQFPSAKSGPCHLSVQGGKPTIQFAAGSDIYVVTANDSFGVTWNRPFKIVDGASDNGQVAGLVTATGDRVASFQVVRGGE